MKNMFKTALCALGAAGALFGASAANAQALPEELNVIIGKIEVVENAENYPASARTVYDWRAGVGASVSRTINLFGNQANGVNLPLRNPGNGIYETVLVHFDQISAVSGVEVLDVAAALDGTLLHNSGGQSVMVLGLPGTGGAGDNSVDTVVTGRAIATADGRAFPMQPVTVSGTNFAMPRLNFGFPAASVVANADGTLAIATPPMPHTRSLSAADNTNVPNILVDVDTNAFAAVPAFNDGVSRITVGLFTPELPAKPLQRRTFTSPATAGVRQLEFLDGPSGSTIVPLAWVDTNNNGELDSGEFVSAHDFVVATSEFIVPAIAAAAADVSYTDVVGRLDAAARAFGTRSVTIAIDMAAHDLSGTIANGAYATNAGITGTVDLTAGTDNDSIPSTNAAPAEIDVTVVYALNAGASVSRTVSTFVGVATPGTADDLDNTEAWYLGLLDSTGAFMCEAQHVDES
jgi:hypothetical protein